MAAASSSSTAQVSALGDSLLLAAKGKADIEVLLQAAADASQRAEGDVTCLHAAAFLDKDKVGSVEVLNKVSDKTLVKRVLGISSKIEGFTPLHIAANVGNDHILTQFLNIMDCLELSDQESASVINARDCIDRTPLHHAVWMGRASVISILLKHKDIDVNAQDKCKYTPLHLALIRWTHSGRNAASLEVIKLLLKSPDIQSDLIIRNKATQNEQGFSLLRSKQQAQENYWKQDVPLPKISEFMFPEDPPMIWRSVLEALMRECVSHLHKDNKEDLKVLDSFLRVEDKTLRDEIEKEIGDELRPQVRKVSHDPVVEKVSVMHLVAYLGLSDLMEILAGSPPFSQYINAPNEEGQTPLHWAVLTGQLGIVELLNKKSTVRGDVEDSNRQTPIEIAHDMKWQSKEKKWDNIFTLMMQRQDVKDYLGLQHEDRSVYVDGTNAILVGATLIASITFSGWLQPPLGYQPYFQFERPAAPPDVYEQYAAINEHTSVKVFWIFNSLSFYFAIASILAGAAVVVPRSDLFVRAEVKRLSAALYLASFAFSWAVVFVVGAFTASGWASLPPIFHYQTIMIVTLAIGLFVSYNTFSTSRSSDPSKFIRYSKYFDPGYYLSTPLTYFYKRLLGRPLGYDVHSERREKRHKLYHNNSVRYSFNVDSFGK